MAHGVSGLGFWIQGLGPRVTGSRLRSAEKFEGFWGVGQSLGSICHQEGDAT